MSSYTKQELIEDHLDRNLSSEEGALVDSVIEHVSEFINNYTNREWLDLDTSALPSAETRLYDSEDRKELFIEDFQSVEEIKFLNQLGDTYETLTDSSKWIEYPLNATVKHSIYLRQHLFPVGQGRVQVKAQFSSGELPSGVSYIATVFAAKFIEQTGQENLYTRESIEGYTRELASPQVKDAEIQRLVSNLSVYKRINL